MNKLEQVISEIHGSYPAAFAAAQEQWAGLAKPLGSLGELENHISRIAALRGTADIKLRKRRLIVMCADNGVVCRGVSQSDASVTYAVAKALGLGCSTVNYLAASAGCEVVPVDIGMIAHETLPGVLDCPVRSGTGDIAVGPAMHHSDCIRAIELGIEFCRIAREDGVDLLLTGEMGIGNTCTSSAVAACLLDLPVESCVGRGAGLSNDGLQRKLEAVHKALEINAPVREDIIDVMSKLGGLDIAGLCGLCLGAALYRIPILLDGVIACTAALCALRLCPASADAMLASHVSSEPTGRLLLDALGLKPLICAGMHLGEGGGAVTALPLLDAALSVYHSGHNFSQLGIEAYTPQS